MQFLPIILVVFIMYMLMRRPQQKKMKAHKAMIAAVKRGDKVVAAGGIIGTVSKVVSDGEVQIEVAEGVRMRVLRSSINDVLNRSDGAEIQDNTPGKAEKADKKRGRPLGLVGQAAAEATSHDVFLAMEGDADTGGAGAGMHLRFAQPVARAHRRQDPRFSSP